jgi:molybdate transport system regulatory protein
LRISSGKDFPLGPGKADLLELVAETGSIGEAAKRMDMSYMRAWMLIQAMNKCFKEPVILTARGGQRGGGAELTDTGRQALALYREMEEASMRATAGSWEKLRQLLRQ